MNLYSSRVIKNQKLNSNFHHFFFKLQNQPFSFKPGQFVILKVSDKVFRSYSIASPPSHLPNWEMIVDITPQGPGTTYLQNLKKGDTIQTSSPTGHLSLKKDSSQNLVFIATGCGIASFKSIIQSLLEQNTQKNIHLLWGLRYPKNIFLKKTLDSWAKSSPKFSYQITLSRPPSSYLGPAGHVDQHLSPIIKKFKPHQTSFYLCGSQDMVTTLSQTLTKLDIPSKHIYFEKYY